jgi:hypothetical protein
MYRKEMYCFEVLDVLFLRLESSSAILIEIKKISCPTEIFLQF